jgi:hypothetical protein
MIDAKEAPAAGLEMMMMSLPRALLGQGVSG